MSQVRIARRSSQHDVAMRVDARMMHDSWLMQTQCLLGYFDDAVGFLPECTDQNLGILCQQHTCESDVSENVIGPPR